MTERKHLLAILITASFLLSGCVVVKHLEKNDILIQEINKNPLEWKKIAILPFTGDPAYRKSGAEWFSFLLKKHPSFEIIGPATAEIRLREGGFQLSDTRIEEDQAIEAGRYLGADAVIVGSAKIKAERGMPLVVGASLIDMNTKKIVVTAVNSGSFAGGYDPEKRLKGATELTAREIIRVLDDISGVQTIPKEKFPEEGESFEMEF